MRSSHSFPQGVDKYPLKAHHMFNVNFPSYFTDFSFWLYELHSIRKFTTFSINLSLTLNSVID